MIQVLKKPTKKESTHVFIKYQASVILKASRFREKFNLMVSGEDFCKSDSTLEKVVPKAVKRIKEMWPNGDYFPSIYP